MNDKDHVRKLREIKMTVEIDAYEMGVISCAIDNARDSFARLDEFVPEYQEKWDAIYHRFHHPAKSVAPPFWP